MPKRLKVSKVVSSVSLTPGAWAILSERSSFLNLSKSEYLENLILRSDSASYDSIYPVLFELLTLTRSQSVLCSQFLFNNQHSEQLLIQLLQFIGTSPNQF